MEKAHSVFAVCLLTSLASLGSVDALQVLTARLLLHSLGLLQRDNLHVPHLSQDHRFHGDELGPRFSADAQAFLGSQVERPLAGTGSTTGAGFWDPGLGDKSGAGPGLNPERFSLLRADGQGSGPGLVHESGFDANNLTNGPHPAKDSRRSDWARSEQGIDFTRRVHAHLNRGLVSGKTEQLQLFATPDSSRGGTWPGLRPDLWPGSPWDATRVRQIRRNRLSEAEENNEPARRGRPDKARINYVQRLASNRTLTGKHGRQAPEPEKAKVQITGGTTNGSASSSLSGNQFVPHSLSSSSDSGHLHRGSGSGFSPPRQVRWRAGPGMLHYIPAGRWGQQVKVSQVPASPGSRGVEGRRSSAGGDNPSPGNFKQEGIESLPPRSRTVALPPTLQHNPDVLSTTSAASVAKSHSNPSTRGHDTGRGALAQTETRARDPSSAIFTGSFALAA